MDVDVVAMDVGRHGLGQVVPPPAVGDQPAVGNEAEPGGEQQGLVVHHLQELRFGHPLDVVDLVGMGLDGQLVLGRDSEEEDVVDLVLPPRTLLAVRDGVGRPVVQAGEELELGRGDLGGGDAQLVIELADGGVLGAGDGAVGHVLGTVDLGRRHAVQGVGAAGVGPDLEMPKQHNNAAIHVFVIVVIYSCMCRRRRKIRTSSKQAMLMCEHPFRPGINRKHEMHS